MLTIFIKHGAESRRGIVRALSCGAKTFCSCDEHKILATFAGSPGKISVTGLAALAGAGAVVAAAEVAGATKGGGRSSLGISVSSLGGESGRAFGG